MTRRIAITILLTVWAAIIAAGVAAWVSARAVLLADLDASLERRALMLPEVTRATGGPPAAFPDDRYVVKDALDKRLDEAAGPRGPAAHRIVDRTFVDLPEGRFRSLTVQFPDPARGAPATVVYRAPAAGFDRVLRQLAIALAVCGAAAGAVAALVAAGLARLSLRPLKETAQVIGLIDESRLHRRIDAAALPPELRPMTERLNEMLARLQQSFEQRRRFLADASHELRTPVAAMITSMEVCLRRARSPEELTQVLQTCLAEARHMRHLVQALLAQVRAQGKLDATELEAVDAGALLRDCAELTGPLAAEKNVRLVPAVNGPVRVRAEPRRLRSVVLNLMSNAIEYNHPGGTVQLSAHAHNGLTEIAVSDDGPGIAPEHLPNVFQPFYRAASAPSADGHLGLGLFLVESHVKAMGGDCRVESTVGAGTTFRVRLPSAGAAEHGAA